MFFINAEGLGNEFFETPVILKSDLNDGYNTSSYSTRANAGPNTLAFGSWLISTVIPLFNQANHARSVSLNNAAITARFSQNENQDIHLDYPLKLRDRLYVTLGVLGSEAGIGTVFTRVGSYEEQLITELDDYDLARDFVSPPERYAAVFDPDTELHAAPAINRHLFKGYFKPVTPRQMHHPLIPIICPNDAKCINPFLNIQVV